MRQRQPPRLRGFARDMRKSATNTESELWQSLRARRLGGLKFRRQVPLNGYILDFVCFEAALVVELDGSQHLGSGADARRDTLMRERGLMTLRFENDDVTDDVDAVCAKILEVANGRRPRALRQTTTHPLRVPPHLQFPRLSSAALHQTQEMPLPHPLRQAQRGKQATALYGLAENAKAHTLRLSLSVGEDAKT